MDLSEGSECAARNDSDGIGNRPAYAAFDRLVGSKCREDDEQRRNCLHDRGRDVDVVRSRVCTADLENAQAVEEYAEPQCPGRNTPGNTPGERSQPIERYAGAGG